MKRHSFLVGLAVLVMPALVQANLRIVTTTADLGAIAREIGQNHVDLFTIAKGYQDPHFVDPKPSFLLKLRQADILMIIGLELEIGWLPPLLQNARNPRILPGNPGYFDASEGCRILQKPNGPIDRSMGDVHPFGNPHYWTDPGNGRTIARRTAEKLSQLDPAHASDYEANLKHFEERLTLKEKEWGALAATFKGVPVVTFHNSWPNFADVYGIRVVNHIEPKAGVPPSPAHVQRLIQQIKQDSIPLILVEPYFDEKLPKRIADASGARLLSFPPSVGGSPGIQTYFDLFDHNLKMIADALRK